MANEDNRAKPPGSAAPRNGSSAGDDDDTPAPSRRERTPEQSAFWNINLALIQLRADINESLDRLIAGLSDLAEGSDGTSAVDVRLEAGRVAPYARRSADCLHDLGRILEEIYRS
jgi:hypothetical protein